jgi:hypothetical protein
MADFRKLSDTPAKNSFAQSVERLDRVVQSVKAQQTAERRGIHTLNEHRANAVSPDETWAKNFSTHGIGPQPDRLPFNLRVPMETQTTMPDPVPQRVAEPSLRGPTQILERTPMAMQIGKPVKRRSWLGRVFFGR